jgi:hypothetical protein
MIENLGAIERRVYSTYWNDGLLDLLASVGVLAIGFFWMRDWAVAAAIIPAWLVPLWTPLRRRLVEPRIGMLEFADDRERLNKRHLRLVVYFGIACLILGLEMYFLRDRFGPGPSVTFIAGLPAFLLAVLALITAFLVSNARFIIYSGTLVCAGVYGALNDWRPGQILALAGIIMLSVSIVVFTKFLHDNPRQPENVE